MAYRLGSWFLESDVGEPRISAMTSGKPLNHPPSASLPGNVVLMFSSCCLCKDYMRRYKMFTYNLACRKHLKMVISLLLCKYQIKINFKNIMSEKTKSCKSHTITILYNTYKI